MHCSRFSEVTYHLTDTLDTEKKNTTNNWVKFELIALAELFFLVGI